MILCSEKREGMPKCMFCNTPTPVQIYFDATGNIERSSEYASINEVLMLISDFKVILICQVIDNTQIIYSYASTKTYTVFVINLLNRINDYYDSFKLSGF